MVCGFCATGCGLDVHLKQGQAVNLSPTTQYSVNQGMACPKGWEALAPLSAADRATTPWVRTDRGLVASDWPHALEAFTSNFKRILQQHGPESVAFLSTGQIPFEEMALLGAFAKFGMGLIHGDGNTRQCMASAVVAYKEAFGFDAPPYTYEDFEQSDVLVFVGANPCIAHPILWERVCKNPHQPEIVVVDPRLTETAQAATFHVPLLPKSDLVLMYAIARELIVQGKINHEFVKQHCNHFEEFAKHVEPFTLAVAVQSTGLEVATLERLSRTIAAGKRVSFWWTMGVNQSHEGVRVAQAIINLALMTGNIGRPGTGANSITGQCNAMGSRLFSNTTNLLGGHAFENAAHRQKIANILGIDDATIPDRPSLAYDQIMEGVLKGKIKGLWVIATNTAHSWINQRDAHEVLKRLEYLVVQDMYVSTETAAFADLVLPAAGWGEKEGTFINAERRLSIIKQVRGAPGQALSDFRIFQLLADAWGCGDMFEAWSSPQATFQLLKRCSEGQPCDITGIQDYQHLDAMRGIQWPLRAGETVEAQSERRLFEDGHFFFPDGRARFVFEAPRPVAEDTSTAFPLILLTGRGSSSQWHTQTRTAKSAVLAKLAPTQPYVEISPRDAEQLAIADNDWVVVVTQRGQCRARAFVTHAVRPGQIFMAMHFAQVNQLTFPAFDPYSRQPSYKHCAARIEHE